MQKLLAKFKQTRTAADALRLLAYLDKHPMAMVCGVAVDDVALINKLTEVRERARATAGLSPSRRAA